MKCWCNFLRGLLLALQLRIGSVAIKLWSCASINASIWSCSFEARTVLGSSSCSWVPLYENTCCWPLFVYLNPPVQDVGNGAFNDYVGCDGWFCSCSAAYDVWLCVWWNVTWAAEVGAQEGPAVCALFMASVIRTSFGTEGRRVEEIWLATGFDILSILYGLCSGVTCLSALEWSFRSTISTTSVAISTVCVRIFLFKRELNSVIKLSIMALCWVLRTSYSWDTWPLANCGEADWGGAGCYDKASGPVTMK